MEHDTMGDDAFHHEEEGVRAQSADSGLPDPSGSTDADELGMEALLAENDYAFRSVRRGETVEGTVVRVDPDEILVDIGLKSEGVIPQREFLSETLEEEPLHVGDRTLVYVIQPEGSEGHAVLSLRRARLERSWRDIEEMYNQGAIVDAPVVDHNKGGLIVDVKGVRGFVPVSQVLDLRNVSRQEGESEEVSHTLAAMNGRRLPLKIIEINRSRNRLILSERAAVQEQRTQRKDELVDQLEPGQVRRGVVSNLTNFGAFVDLGGADGLVHVSELSYNRVNHPSEILRVGQEVDVMVLSVDRDTKKIALSLKRAMPDPWTTVEEQYHVGQVVSATITKLAKFGAFAKVEDGLEGLIHLSELTDLAVQDPAQVTQEGQQVKVKIIHINMQRRRLGLSVRQAGSNQLGTQSSGEATTDTYQEFEAYTPEEFANPVLQMDPLNGAVVSDEPEATVVESEPEQPATQASAAPAEVADALSADESVPSIDTQPVSTAPSTGEAASIASEPPTGEAASTASEPPTGEAANIASEPPQSDQPSGEGVTNAGEQPSSAAQLEPVDSSPVENEPVAATSSETPQVEGEVPTTDGGDEQPEVASAARQGSVSE
jgi:small subunit ribosomal protein S1